MPRMMFNDENKKKLVDKQCTEIFSERKFAKFCKKIGPGCTKTDNKCSTEDGEIKLK